MTFEVELKFRITDAAALEQKFLACGAIPGLPEQQTDCYLAHPCRDFAVTDEALRIRTVGSQHLLTYKGPVLDPSTKTRREIELPLGTALECEQWQDLLAQVGFHPALTVRKLRRPFRLDWQGRSFHVSVDDVPEVGQFLELETLSEAAELPEAQRAVHELANFFELSAAEEKTYLELVREVTTATETV